MRPVDDFVASLLDVTVQRYAVVAPGLTVPAGDALPERRYVGHGQPGSVAADGPSLMAVCTGIEPHTGGDGRPSVMAGAMVTYRASIQLRLLRAASVYDDQGQPPPADTITTESRRLARDATRLLETWVDWAESVLPKGMNVTPGQVEPIAPQGQLAGLRVTGTIGPL